MATCGCIYYQMCLEKYLMNCCVDSGNQTPVNGDITHMNELRLLGGEDQNSSKITDKVSSSIQITKENSDQATSPIVNVKLLTDVTPEAPIPGESLDETSKNATSIFLQLFDKIDSTESKNKDASRGLIYGYFDFGEADGSQVLAKSEVREVISEAKCSYEALWKRMERSEKIYKLFNSIGKEKIAQIKSISGFHLKSN
ncbi:hypothetical protein RhiirA1_456784 [Rhizophagus irregularis]|uniref:Uncharacterized protein n=1 Tax=Rhizophagus irregularis TaxID=588596 RepID=A0A2N0RZT7_9GLOM|nr:hypothetical protein RhiirA1_456784 [Rhizophagus irregularis]